MGNVSCMVSGVTIGNGDLIYVIGLNINKPHDGNYSMVYCNEMFEPATLPVLCKYDDDEFDFNINFEDQIVLRTFLENKYNKSIEDIFSIDGGCFKGMSYIHSDVFNTLCQYLDECTGKPALNWDYDKSYEQFKKTIIKCIADAKSNIEMYEKILETTTDEYNKLDIQKQIITEKMALLKPAELFDIINFVGFRRHKNIITDYFDFFQNDDFKPLICALYNFSANLMCVGRHWTPTVYGQQYGNPFMVSSVLSVATKINQLKLNKLVD